MATNEGRGDGARRTRMPRAERREQLLETAEGLVLREGIRALSMERLAEEARIAKTVVYSQFDNSTAVLLEVLRRHWQHIDEQLEAAAGDHQPFAEYLRGYATVYLGETAPERLLLRRLLQAARQDDEAREVIWQRQDGRKMDLGQRIHAEFGLDKALAHMVSTILLGGLGALGAEAYSSERQRRRAVEAFLRGAMAVIGEFSKEAFGGK